MTSEDRRRLVGALLEDPSDVLALLALADACEEDCLPRQAGLLRLACALREEVAYPAAEADAECRACWVDATYPAWPDVTRYRSEAWNHDGRRRGAGQSPEWPHDCRGWHGAGRLPGCAAAYHLLALPHAPLAGADLPALRRHVLRCELYSCGVIGARERDAEWPTFCAVLLHSGASRLLDQELLALRRRVGEGGALPPPSYGPVFADVERLWALRGGRAAAALHVMLRLEAAATRPLDAEYQEFRRSLGPAWYSSRRREGDAVWERRRLAQALARTYSRSLARRFLAGGGLAPRELGLGLRAPADGRNGARGRAPRTEEKGGGTP